MQTQRTAIYKTRKGKVAKQVTEHYLSDGIFCGLKDCEECEKPMDVEFALPRDLPETCTDSNAPFVKLQTYLDAQSSEGMSDKDGEYTLGSMEDMLSKFDKDTPLIVVPDDKVFQFQMDLLESKVSAFGNMIILQSVMDDIAQKQYKTYQRMRSLVNASRFKVSETLTSNFTGKSESASGSNKDNSVTPYVYVFGNVFHQQIYTQTEMMGGNRDVPYEIQYAEAMKRALEMQALAADDDVKNVDEIDLYDDLDGMHSLPMVTKIVDLGVLVQRETSETQEENEEESDKHPNRILIGNSIRWLQQHIGDKACVVLMTNTGSSAEKYRKQGVPSVDAATIVAAFEGQYPTLRRVLAKTVDDKHLLDRSKWVYDAHLKPSEVKEQMTAKLVFPGLFEVNRDYWAEGFVSTKEHGRVLITDFRSMNRAIHGDKVIVKLLPKSEWKVPSRDIGPSSETLDGVDENVVEEVLQDTAQATEHVDESMVPVLKLEKNIQGSVPTGVVVAISERNQKSLCGSIELTDKQSGRVMFLPVNRCYPKIFIESEQVADLVDQRVMVAIDEWPISSKHPHGHLVRVLGSIGNIAAETEVLLLEHDVKHDKWSAAVEACLPGDDYEIDDNERSGRVDLREVCVCSIDPPGCVDIDDALHCIELANGNFEVGVHIADVTHYMQPESALDKEAAARSTSVYLVDRRIDMIPARLSTNLCSLHEKVERLAFSCVWVLDKDGNILETKFFKSVIKSKAALAYSDAQARIDTQEPKDEITTSCINLMNLARKIKDKRIAMGALTLASSEVKFKLSGSYLDSDRDVKEVGMYQTTEAHSLVEEFMLLANVSVAKQILSAFPTMALLRRHPTPSADMLQTLVRAAKAWNYNVDISNGKNLNDSLDKMVDKKDAMFNKMVRMLTTRCMTRAKYVSSGEMNEKAMAHFGLAAEAYTHFTSPIRRYADVLAHRLLATSLGIAPLPDMIRDKAHMRDVVDNLNLRHHNAQLSSRASTDVWTLAYFTGKNVTVTGRILAVRTSGIRVLIPQFGIECAIRLIPSEYTSQIFTVPEDDSASRYHHDFMYDPNAVTLHVKELCFKVWESVEVNICVKENKMRRRWLSVELSGKLGKELLSRVPELSKFNLDGTIVSRTDKETVEIVSDEEEPNEAKHTDKKRKTKK